MHATLERPRLDRPPTPPPDRPGIVERVARGVVRHRRAVIVGWIVALVLTAAVGSNAFSALSAEFGGGSGTESGQVRERLDARDGSAGEIAVLVDGVNPFDPAVAVQIAPVLGAVRALPGVLDVTDAWSVDDPALRSTDSDAGLAVVTLSGDLGEEQAIEVAHEVEDIVAAIARDVEGAEVLVGGDVLVGEEFEVASERDLLRGEAIALPIAIAVMVVVLGGFVAAGMPLLVAIAGVITSLSVLVAATLFGDVSIFSINVVNMLGIGLGIDYGLLMVNRFREERGRGAGVEEAVIRTVRTAGVTVVFSAVTVAVAMTGLFVFGVPILTSFGIAGLAVVLLSMLASVTLLPAVMAGVGGRIRPLAPKPDELGRFHRIARWAQRRAGAVTVVIGVLLVALGLPFLGARLENGDARALPRSSEVRELALVLADRFPSRGADPLLVVADADPASPELAAWTESLAALPGVAGVHLRADSGDGLAIVELTPTGTSQGDTAIDLVRTVRDAEAPFAVQVGGAAAELVDVRGHLADRLPWAALVVVLATLVLLFLMTGSVIVPIKAVLMNVLSLGASFGALVWIFQDGNLSGLLQFDSVGALDLWMPILILIFAFGLSMDYEVFLLSRIKELHDELGDNDAAVAIGLQRSGRIITTAASLIVIVFLGFAAGEVLAIKQLGVGLAIAVIVDATLIRTLLVPATMRLLGDRNWWAPPALRRFHDRFGLRETSDVIELDGGAR